MILSGQVTKNSRKKKFKSWEAFSFFINRYLPLNENLPYDKNR